MRRPTALPLRAEVLEDRTAPAQLRLGVAAAIPDDPQYGGQWGLGRVGAPDAWDVATGSTRVVVASIDSGVDYTHPDLYLNVWLNQTEIPQTFRSGLVDADGDQLITFRDLNARAADGTLVNGLYANDANGNGYVDAADLLRPLSFAADGRVTGGWEDGTDGGPGTANGFADDLVGWDFVQDDNKPFDDYGHGTHTAGTIGATGNNAVGVTGVAWGVQIMVVKLIASNNTADMADAPRTITYAAENGARVSNCSWGVTGQRSGDALYTAIKNAGERYGNIVVAAAMNNGLDNDRSPFRSYPASYDLPNIITVAATNPADRLASWSNYGKVSVDLAAPGVNILSTTMGGGYGYASGTSMSAAFVSGAVALVLSVDPGLSVAAAKSIILNSVDPVAGLPKKILTGGRLNVAQAVRAASTA